MDRVVLIGLALLCGLIAHVYCRWLWWRIHGSRGLYHQLPDRTGNEVRYVRDFIDKWVPTVAMLGLAIALGVAALLR